MDSQIHIIDSKTGKSKRGISEHEGTVTAVSFVGSSNSILSCSWDYTTRLWNRKKIEESLVLKHSSEVKTLAFSTKLGRGASGSRDGMVKIFSQRRLKTLRNLQAHRADISGLSIISDQQRLVTASYDGQCRLWDLTSYEPEKTLVKQKERIRSMTTTLDGMSVLLGLQSGRVTKIGIENVREKVELSGHTDIVNSIAVDPTGRYVATGSWDRTIRIWSLEDNSEVARGQLLTGISAVTWSPDGSTIYTADQSGAVVSWTSFD